MTSEITSVNKNLIISEKDVHRKAPAYYREFNDNYLIFTRYENVDSLTEEEKQERIEAGVKAAIVVANKFDFEDEMFSELKEDYISFARQMLYEASSKPYYNENAAIYLIRALYGQTRIAYPHSKEHLEDGNKWVTHLERNTKNRTLKAYALALRAYVYVVYGKELEIPVDEIFKFGEKEMIYATKWDEENYLAYLCLGLIYYDKGNPKFDIDKALTNFNKAYSFKNEYCVMDEYVSYDDKMNLMDNALRLADSIRKGSN